MFHHLLHHLPHVREIQQRIILKYPDAVPVSLSKSIKKVLVPFIELPMPIWERGSAKKHRIGEKLMDIFSQQILQAENTGGIGPRPDIRRIETDQVAIFIVFLFNLDLLIGRLFTWLLLGKHQADGK